MRGPGSAIVNREGRPSDSALRSSVHMPKFGSPNLVMQIWLCKFGYANLVMQISTTVITVL